MTKQFETNRSTELKNGRIERSQQATDIQKPKIELRELNRAEKKKTHRNVKWANDNNMCTALCIDIYIESLNEDSLEIETQQHTLRVLIFRHTSAS